MCLYARDLKAQKEFYMQVLGFELYSEVPDRHVFLRAGEQMLLIFNPAVTALDQRLPPHWANGQQHIAFEADFGQYERMQQKLRSAEVDILAEQVWGSDKHSFYFHDPAGNLLEITQPGIWE